MALFFYKEKNKDIRAAAYLRLSIEDGDKAESNSIGNQRELIRDFAAERPGLHLVEEYADDGYTGTNFHIPPVADSDFSVRNRRRSVHRSQTTDVPDTGRPVLPDFSVHEEEICLPRYPVPQNKYVLLSDGSIH